MANLAPAIGDWFIDRSQQQLFEVVAIDEHASTIEVQYLDGEVSEIDLDSWGLLPIETAAPPEDWSAPFEVDAEDMDNELHLASPAYDPLSLLESEMFEGFDEF